MQPARAVRILVVAHVGESRIAEHNVSDGPGLSPHTRGSRRPIPARYRTLGSIPAHAGSHAQRLGPLLRRRSIPAHAGEPSPPRPTRRWSTVYPRTRGGAGVDRERLCPSEGLSPHTRGSHLAKSIIHSGGGSIPAHAGEPHQLVRLLLAHQVYPRTRGEPRGHGRPRCRTRVYPRTRGGAAANDAWDGILAGLSPHTRGARSTRQPASCHPGLSPHTRGSRSYTARRWSGVRSIPAHAGSRLERGLRGDRPRSIPAHAGEPPSAMNARNRSAVYPRTRGGAHPRGTIPHRDQGLSPHTRGSRRPDNA